MLASVIITRATDVLQDTTSIRWPEAELLRWMSDAQREIVLYKPEASVTNGNLSLTANTSKQSLPDGGLKLIDVVRNMGSNGTTPGRAIRIVMREVLDSQKPNWHSETGSEVKHFTHDGRDPRNFYVYPAIASTHYIEAVYSTAPGQRDTSNGAVTPGDITATTKYTSLDDIYANIILDYMLYRAYTKDAEYAGNGQRAIAHYTGFATALGIRTTKDREQSPNANSAYNPNNPVQAKG